MRYSTPIITILISIALFLPQFSFSQVSLKTFHFDIHAHDENLSREVKIILESSYRRIVSFLEDSLTDVVSVYVVDSEEEFVSMVGNSFPDWGIGCAIPTRNLIILKSPRRFTYHRPFSQVVTHELAHIFLGKLSQGKRVPRWLDEGFAMYQSQEWRIGQDVAVGRAVLTGSVLPLSQIESVNAFKESKAQLAYTESFLAVSYLYREYGEGTIKELVTHLAHGTSIDLAFMRTIGSNYLSFQLEFEKHIKEKYNWVSFLGDTFLVWIGLAFLIVFLYLLKRRYAKKILKEWELEEQGIKRIDEFTDDQT
ncbi:MAG: hypothetical protein AMJ91_05335 [candidate division Zixibacteria bacterium SM23_73_3]|nr:MAG: hypothetical protein AMJ91_05335 [candidate division Zixibacteria bacterium SM23_73_3]